MTRDDIIRMAQEARGTTIPSFNNETIHFGFVTEEIEKFVALVAAHEREACAEACEQKSAIRGGEIFAARIRARGQLRA